MFVLNRYGYRSATVRDIVCEIPLVFVSPLREMLAMMAGKSPDNHEVYTLSGFGFHRDISIGFSDWKCYIGLGVHVESENLKTEINRELPEASGLGSKDIFAWIKGQKIPKA